MEKYLNAPIKELIVAYPKIGQILDEYKIGCVPCSVGSCLFKDIVEIHSLSPREEGELMKRIAAVIFPGKRVEIPALKRRPSAGRPQELSYAPGIKELVEEHLLIKRWLALIPEVIKKMDLASPRDKKLILDGVDFIRSYADRFHHAKEEDILFKYFDADLDIIKTMLTDHEAGRGHVRGLIEAVRQGDKQGAAEHLVAYMEQLKQHIKKEDEILYPWMQNNLSMRQIGEMYAQFQKADERLGKETPERCRRFVEEAEKRFLKSNTSRKNSRKK